MKHEYRELTEHIHAPETLKDRVLTAAREGNKACRPERRLRPMVRAAVCAALALTLVLGGLRFTERKKFGGPPVSSVLTYELGLTAQAACANGGLAFLWAEDGGFQITGEEISQVTLSIDRGALLKNGHPLENGVAAAYDPADVYGFQAESEDVYDGAALTVTAVFTDGAPRTLVYHLTAEMLESYWNEDGTEVLVPGLAGADQGVSALYAVSREESRWLLWPVEGSNTVSLSAPYGLRKDGGYFHAGIDIPGEQGTFVTAAHAGTVLETGFDRERGNYVVLDHGDGLTTLYGQCQEVLAAEGDRVQPGDAVALLGSTGMSTGPHLHFEVRQNGTAQNPVAYFNSDIRDTLRMG